MNIKARVIIAFILASIGSVGLLNHFFIPSGPVTTSSPIINPGIMEETATKPDHISFATKSASSLEIEETDSKFLAPKKATPITSFEDSLEHEEIQAPEDDTIYPEPTAENADLPALGFLADQVNLSSANKPCKRRCADSTNVTKPATGEYADQINPSNILQQAKNEGVIVESGEELVEVQTDSHPPVETGAYITPD